MTSPALLRYHGQHVIVYDARGRYLSRGTVVGVHRCDPPLYDVQPDREGSMARRMCGIPASQIRSARAESSVPQFVRDVA